jgi:hypothetical protein
VRLRPRRKAVRFDDSSLSFEVVDSFVWDGVVEVAKAAHRQDAHANLEAFRRLGAGRSLAVLRLAGFYALYLLKYRTGTILGRRPSVDDISVVASRVQADFDRVLPNSPAGSLVDTLLVAFEYRSLQSLRPTVTGSTHMLRALVALGLLLDAPSHDLAMMKPHLASWCARQAENIRRICNAPEGS